MNQLPSNLNDLVMTFLQIRDRWSFGMNFLHVRGGGGGGGGGGGQRYMYMYALEASVTLEALMDFYQGNCRPLHSLYQGAKVWTPALLQFSIIVGPDHL